MSPKIEKRPLQTLNSNRIDASEGLELDSACLRGILTESRIRIGEDQIAFRRWRRGFIIFYGAMALLLGALAVAVDRSGAITAEATTAKPPIAVAATQRHQRR